ncbi:hypothetical protein [Streptomyces sp. JJ36]|uniref:hypothetical protein n=1 Tax=Streptomyces sp. JJ36 TaxID=2736645 RepID=UPI001F1D67EC|nr:hypothetical protein [Streptomyces sp. JJ36]MCF6522712.1 hypothetical protein [Streptomyces sp. JJ36]
MTAHGAVPRDPCQWTGTQAALLPALSALRARGLQADLLYTFSPDEEDSPTSYGAELCLVPEGAAPLQQGRPVLLDSEDEETVLANDALTDLLAPVATGPEWLRRQTDGLWELATAPTLPEPVVVAGALEFDQGTTGLWMIAHDGRRVLTPGNLDFLQRRGIAVAETYQVDGETYPVAPVRMFSGQVVERLLAHGVEFSDPPVYLVEEAASDAAAVQDVSGRSRS